MATLRPFGEPCTSEAVRAVDNELRRALLERPDEKEESPEVELAQRIREAVAAAKKTPVTEPSRSESPINKARFASLNPRIYVRLPLKGSAARISASFICIKSTIFLFFKEEAFEIGESKSSKRPSWLEIEKDLPPEIRPKIQEILRETIVSTNKVKAFIAPDLPIPPSVITRGLKALFDQARVPVASYRLPRSSWNLLVKRFGA